MCQSRNIIKLLENRNVKVTGNIITLHCEKRNQDYRNYFNLITLLLRNRQGKCLFR